MARASGKASLGSRASAELRCKIGRSSPKRNRHLEGTGSFAFHIPIRRSRLCRRHPLRPVPQAHLRPACGRAGDDVPRGDGGVRYCALRHPPSRRSPGRRVSKGAIPNAAVTAGDVIAGAAASRPKVRLRYRAEGMPPTEAGTPDRNMESKGAGTFEVPVSFWRRSPNFTPELRRSTTAKAGFARSPRHGGG